MLKPRLILIVGICCSLLALMTATPAFADVWSNTDCTQNPTPGCDLQAGNDPNTGAPSPGPGPDSTHVSNPVDPKQVRCSYVRSDFQPPPGNGSGLQTASYSETPLNGLRDAVVTPVPASGAWYMYQCTGNGVRDALYRPPVWIPNGPPGAVLPAAAALAARAESMLRLPAASVVVNPAGEQLVNLPTWLWLAPGSWGAVSATAAVPGESVTATAAPVSTSWSMGDGSTVSCTGPGTPYPADGADPAAGSPDCGYTYRMSSAGQPGQVFVVTATVRWQVTWAGGGQSGTFAGLMTTGSLRVPVAESQVLNTH